MNSPHSVLSIPLSFEQARVLGCLLEKEVTVPDSYPLTLNQLLSACNQSSNREPITDFDEATVSTALEGLRQQLWVFQLSQAGARVPKLKHNLPAKLPDLSKAAVALLTTLLLRGPQTAGELRQRTERMHPFEDLAAVESTLQELTANPEGALAICLPSGNGRRVAQYMHLFCGPVDPDLISTASAPKAVVIPPPPPIVTEEWKLDIEQQLAQLREQIQDLRAQLGISSEN